MMAQSIVCNISPGAPSVAASACKRLQFGPSFVKPFWQYQNTGIIYAFVVPSVAGPTGTE